MGADRNADTARESEGPAVAAEPGLDGPPPSAAPVPSDPPPAGPLPVVLLHGFSSDPDIFRGSERFLRERGLLPVLVGWAPAPGQDAFAAATDTLLPRIEEELARAGRAGSRFAVVAHSMSGLLVRWLLEHARPDLGPRVEALVMISTPNHGPRTGVANWACATWPDPDWRRLGCALRPGSELIRGLGRTPPSGPPTRYLAIGVDGLLPMIPLPGYDGDGDGVRSGHDLAVMAESTWLDGVPFAVWRAWGRLGDHFGSTCALELNEWAADFVLDGTLPQPARGRVRATDLCREISKAQWHRARDAASRRGDGRTGQGGPSEPPATATMPP